MASFSTAAAAEPGRRETVRAIEAGEIAEQEPQRIVEAQFVVAIGDDEEDAGRVETPGQIFDEIECRGVGPVNVLDDEDGRLRAVAQRLEQLRKDRPGAVARLDLRRKIAAERPGDVVQRAEHGRRQQRIAIAAKDARALPVEAGKMFDQRGLADTGFAAHQRHLTGALTRRLEQPVELREIALPLEKIALGQSATPEGHQSASANRNTILKEYDWLDALPRSAVGDAIEQFGEQVSFA